MLATKKVLFGLAGAVVLMQSTASPGAIPLSSTEHDHITQWLASEQSAGRLNDFGDPVDMMYMGGSPLFDEMSGEVTELHDYVARRHPHRPWHAALGEFRGCEVGSENGHHAGGYHNREPADDDIKEIASFAASELRGELIEVQCPRTQVVAGINYSMVVVIDFDEAGMRKAFRVQVYKPLPHTQMPPSLKAAEDLGEVYVGDK